MGYGSYTYKPVPAHGLDRRAGRPRGPVRCLCFEHDREVGVDWRRGQQPRRGFSQAFVPGE